MRSKSELISLIALIGVVWFVLASVYLQIIRTDLNVIRDTLSLYAIGKSGSILETGFYSIGLTQILIAFLLLKNDGVNNYSAISLFLAGVGVVIVGVFPTHVEPVDSLVKLPHLVGATMQFILFPVALLLLLKDLSDSRFRYVTTLLGIVTAALFLMIAALFFVSVTIDINFFGLIEKLEIYLIDIWLICIASKLSRPGGALKLKGSEPISIG